MKTSAPPIVSHAAYLITALCLCAPVHAAVTYADLSATPSKLSLFTGGSASVDSFFTSYNAALLLRTSANNLKLNYDSSWNAASMPQVANQTYARIGDGQCVTFVKTMVDNFTPASSWKPSGQVTGYWDANALVGKAIATFPNGVYSGHTAIILAAWKTGGSNTITNVWVADSNYTPTSSYTNGGTIAKHELRASSGTSVSNLHNYFIVKVAK